MKNIIPVHVIQNTFLRVEQGFINTYHCKKSQKTADHSVKSNSSLLSITLCIHLILKLKSNLKKFIDYLQLAALQILTQILIFVLVTVKDPGGGALPLSVHFFIFMQFSPNNKLIS